MFVCFGFNIWHAAAAYFGVVAIEQFTNFVKWRKVLPHKIQKIISDFCFDISSIGGLTLNQITFRFLFSLLITGFF